MTGFEEFLNSHKKESIELVMFIDGLGEWAWKKGLKRGNESSLQDFWQFQNDLHTGIYCEIAVACLGKVEVERRLGELK